MRELRYFCSNRKLFFFLSQDGLYRGRTDAWYGRYKGQPAAYRDPNYSYREPQPERPSSRASQYSDRPSDRPSSRSAKVVFSVLCHYYSTSALFLL